MRSYARLLYGPSYITLLLLILNIQTINGEIRLFNNSQMQQIETIRSGSSVRYILGISQEVEILLNLWVESTWNRRIFPAGNVTIPNLTPNTWHTFTIQHVFVKNEHALDVKQDGKSFIFNKLTRKMWKNAYKFREITLFAKGALEVSDNLPLEMSTTTTTTPATTTSATTTSATTTSATTTSATTTSATTTSATTSATTPTTTIITTTTSISTSIETASEITAAPATPTRSRNNIITNNIARAVDSGTQSDPKNDHFHILVTVLLVIAITSICLIIFRNRKTVFKSIAERVSKPRSSSESSCNPQNEPAISNNSENNSYPSSYNPLNPSDTSCNTSGLSEVTYTHSCHPKTPNHTPNHSDIGNHFRRSSEYSYDFPCSSENSYDFPSSPQTFKETQSTQERVYTPSSAADGSYSPPSSLDESANPLCSLGTSNNSSGASGTPNTFEAPLVSVDNSTVIYFEIYNIPQDALHGHKQDTTEEENDYASPTSPTTYWCEGNENHQ
ncbi:hypothetical protein SK128_012936 [Halocaridina rubra]|uniref:Uncharacterized protein n=1 Tax=Halocaridina rubra TaxID=373956 RepID=A0AAN8ZPS1_HALRR